MDVTLMRAPSTLLRCAALPDHPISVAPRRGTQLAATLALDRSSFQSGFALKSLLVAAERPFTLLSARWALVKGSEGDDCGGLQEQKAI